MDGILLIDKPRGISSFGALRIVRRVLGIRKVGHAGTLDPLATGLLVVGVGKGTKALTGLLKLDKEYIADIRIGESRTTGDLEGDVQAVRAVTSDFSLEKVTAELTAMLGTLTLPVSAYSAIKVDGVPMYRRARKAEKLGEVVAEVPIRMMRVDVAEYLSHEDVSVDGVPMVCVRVRFVVGSGTYIRSLAEELGKRLGYPACLSALRRTQVGDFTIAHATAPEAVTAASLMPIPEIIKNPNQ